MILLESAIFGFYYYVNQSCLDVATLRDVELQTPMQVFSQDGKLIFNLVKSASYSSDLWRDPRHLVEALIATEDSYFTSTWYWPNRYYSCSDRLLCRVLQNGGESTITQQLARNFFLSNEKRSCVRLKRTIAIHIEQLLSKEEIMEPRKQDLLGHRSYGFLRRCSTRPTLVKIFRINLSELADPSRYASILQPWTLSTLLNARPTVVTLYYVVCSTRNTSLKPSLMKQAMNSL